MPCCSHSSGRKNADVSYFGCVGGNLLRKYVVERVQYYTVQLNHWTQAQKEFHPDINGIAVVAMFTSEEPNMSQH